MSVLKTAVKILFIISVSKSELYTDEEIKIIKSLGSSLGVKFFAFIQNDKSTEIIKIFSNDKLYSAIIDLHEFYIILNGDVEHKKFFAEKKILVTKENLNFTSALEKVSGTQLVSWIVFTKSFDQFNNSYIPVNMNFFVVQNEDGITIQKAYSIKPGLNTTLKKIGNWPTGSTQHTLTLTKEKKIDFEGAKLKMLYLSDEEECSSRVTKHVLDRIECFHHELLKMIAEYLNFKIEKVQITEKLYPYNYPNGSLSDFFLILHRNEADVSCGSYIISNHRLDDNDFAWPTFTTRSMMYLKYESSKSSWRAYLRPLQRQLWQAIVSWIFLTGILIQIFNELRLGDFKFRISIIAELMQAMFLSLQIFCNQGLHNMTNYYSTRIIFMGTFLLFVSLYQAYSGFLISSLTIATPDIPFTDLNEFLRDGTYKMMTLKKGFHNFYVKKIFEQLGKDKRNLILSEDKLPIYAEKGIEILCTKRKITYVEFRENIVQHDLSCKITEVHKPMFYQSVGIGFPKNTPYKNIINQQLGMFRSTGILHRMKKFLHSYVKLHEREKSAEPFLNVSLDHVKSILFLFGTSVGVSGFVFVLEKIWHYRNSQIQKRKRIKRKHLKWQRYCLSDL